MIKVLVTLPRDEVIRIQYKVTDYMCHNATHQIISPHTELLEVRFNATYIGVRDHTLLSSPPPPPHPKKPCCILSLYLQARGSSWHGFMWRRRGSESGQEYLEQGASWKPEYSRGLGNRASNTEETHMKYVVQEVRSGNYSQNLRAKKT